jgi:hypothetical protein
MLERMRLRAPQWAACLTYQYRTFGIHSTQRAEAIHSAMQSRFADKNSTFLQLVKDLERMSEELEFRSFDKGYRDTLRSKLLRVTGNNPVIYLPGDQYGHDVSGHARHLITAQCVNLVQFKVERHDDGPKNVPLQQQQYFTQRLIAKENVASIDKHQDFVLDVEFGLQYCYDEAGHITTLQSCTCQFPDCHGIACAHMWAVAHSLNCANVLDYLMPCDPFYRESIDLPTNAQDVGAARVVEAVPPPSHLTTKASRKTHLLQLGTVLSDLASDSFSQTDACARLLTECIENANRIRSEAEETGNYIPNPQVHGKNQNQKRKQPVCGPTTATSNRQAREVKSKRKKQAEANAQRLTGSL